MVNSPTMVKKNKIKRYPVLAEDCKVCKKVKKKKIKRYPVSWPLIISRTDPSEDPKGFRKATKEILSDFVEEISTEVGWLENLTESPSDIGFSNTSLYPYQKAHMNNYNKYRWMNKSRQIGASYGLAAEGLSKCHLLDHYTKIFVSYNQEEANEKINYARAMFESLPLKYQRKIIVDRVTALEFEKRTSGRRCITRLISHPQRAVRGKGGNVDVDLDEFAHFTWDTKIYVAAVPVITRGFGQITVASSPLGRTSLHWQIGEDKKRYPSYTRQYIYWYNCFDFINNYGKLNFSEVQIKAPLMSTEERVLTYGNEAIIQAYYSSLLEDFQQEYELRPFDERESYYPMDLIKSCTFESLRGIIEVDEEDEYGDSPEQAKPVHQGLEYKKYNTIRELSRDVSRGKVSKFLYGGYDVGRYENASELFIIEEFRGYENFQMVRLALSAKNMEFEKQRRLLDEVFKYLPIRKLKIDATGIGKDLGEYIKKKYGTRVSCIDFNAQNKQDMCVGIKIRMEDQMIGYQSDRDLIKQIHSIKREISQANKVKFASEEDRTHHGDKFWALALASDAGSPIQKLYKFITPRMEVVGNSSNVIVLANKRQFPKNKDEFILPGGVDIPPLHVASLGATIINIKR